MKKPFSGTESATIKKILRLLKADTPFIILSLLFAAVSIVLSLYVNVLVGRAVDFMVGKGEVDLAGVEKCVLKIGICILISAAFNYLMNLILNKIAYKTVKTLRNSLFSKLQTVSISYIDRHSPGDMISRLINDIEQISDGLILSFAQLFSGVVTIVTTLVFMLRLDYKITIIVVIATPVTLIIAKFIAKSTYKYFVKQTKENGELSALCEENITGIAVIKAFGKEDEVLRKLNASGERLRAASTSAVFFSSTVNPTTRIINGIIYAAVGVVGAITVINGKFYVQGGLTVGLLSSFLAYANQFSKPFNEISGVLAEFQGALSGAARVFDVLETENESELTEAEDTFEAEGNVTIDNISFSYNPEVPLIENFSADVKKGMRVAIVGPTGCGKTTFINLLMRFYDVDRGKISIDGKDCLHITRDAIHRNYGMVLQETWLRSGTIRENIALGNEKADTEQITEAARLCHAHNFIMRLEKGYDTVISNDSQLLSYGERQLICIARLMLSHPPMLILDEATSSIDTRTEIRVQQGFARLMKGKTSFIVAHRLSTIKNCDIIIVMKDGKIIEKGSHCELLASGGFYRELYEAQGVL